MKLWVIWSININKTIKTNIKIQKKKKNLNNKNNQKIKINLLIKRN